MHYANVDGGEIMFVLTFRRGTMAMLIPFLLENTYTIHRSLCIKTFQQANLHYKLNLALNIQFRPCVKPATEYI